jgi:phosphomannomutase
MADEARAKRGSIDAIVSTDGDGDRPLIAGLDADGRVRFFGGDTVGIAVADWLAADCIAVPVSATDAIDLHFEPRGIRIARTRIGSPYVIAAMQAAGGAGVVGYEANGGFLIQSDLHRAERRLAALPTRDAVIVALGVLLLAIEREPPLSGLARLLPARFTASARLREFPVALARERLAALSAGGAAAVERDFAADFGPVAAIDETDGLRVAFASGEIAHLRPSGNAPELRCYNEAASPERAAAMNRRCLEILSRWRDWRPADGGGGEA